MQIACGFSRDAKAIDQGCQKTRMEQSIRLNRKDADASQPKKLKRRFVQHGPTEKAQAEASSVHQHRYRVPTLSRASVFFNPTYRPHALPVQSPGTGLASINRTRRSRQLVALNNGLGAIRGTAVHHQDFCNCLRLSNETFKTIFDSRRFVKDRKDNANTLGAGRGSGLQSVPRLRFGLDVIRREHRG